MHPNDTNRKTLIHPELSYRLTGIFYEVHNKLGRNLLEKQYADAVEISLKKNNIDYLREAKIFIDYNGTDIAAGTADFIIDDKIIVDCKAKKFITKDDYNQLLRYLKSRKLHLGMLVNFRNSYLKPKRILNNDFY